MTDRRDVMISSTARDLPDHRTQAKAAIEQCGAVALVMENLPASPNDAITDSLKLVDEAEYYVGIFAHRYGYVPDSPRNPDRISITEMEYRRAVERNIPRLIFLVGDGHDPLPEDESPDGAAKLRKLKDHLQTTYVVNFFTSPEDLRGHVLHALIELLGFNVRHQPPPLPDPGTLPDVGTLPPGSRVMMGRNPNFVGREDDLRALAQSLLYSADDAKAVITPAAAATGSGGIGKTQLALEFAHRYGRYFTGVHWINLLGHTEADPDPLTFRAEIAVCGRQMDLPNFPAEQPEQVRVTLAAWGQTAPRLVILDNVENPAVVGALLPRLERLRVLVTSRWGEAGDWRALGVDACGLDVLPRPRSRELLRRLAPHLESVPNAELDRLCARLGDYPLALDLAGRYLHDMRRVGLSVADYLKKLDETNPLEHSSLRGWAAQQQYVNPTQHDMDVAATFRLSWEKVDNPLAARLFRACGYLAPSVAIPPDLLRRLAENDVEALAGALRQLSAYGLLAPDPTGDAQLVIHPLLADFARGLDAEADDSALPALAGALSGASYEANETGLPAQFEPLRPHLEAAAPHVESAGLENAGMLWNSLGYHLDMVADLAGARAHYERALRIVEGVLGAEHPNVATLINNLGSVLQDLGDLAGARAHYERALRIVEKVLGPEHPNVATTVNNLGLVLKALGDLAGARDAFDRALRIDAAAFGPDHPNVATDVNNLGLVLKALGDLAGARAAYERALRIDEAAFGPDHPNVARDVNNLAGVFYAEGDLAGARDAFDRALRILVQFLPPDHPYITNLRGKLAALDDD